MRWLPRFRRIVRPSPAEILRYAPGKLEQKPKSSLTTAERWTVRSGVAQVLATLIAALAALAAVYGLWLTRLQITDSERPWIAVTGITNKDSLESTAVIMKNFGSRPGLNVGYDYCYVTKPLGDDTDDLIDTYLRTLAAPERPVYIRRPILPGEETEELVVLSKQQACDQVDRPLGPRDARYLLFSIHYYDPTGGQHQTTECFVAWKDTTPFACAHNTEIMN